MTAKIIANTEFFGTPEGTRRGRPSRRLGKKVSGGHFFSPGESPNKQDGIPIGVLACLFLFFCRPEKESKKTNENESLPVHAAYGLATIPQLRCSRDSSLYTREPLHFPFNQQTDKPESARLQFDEKSRLKEL